MWRRHDKASSGTRRDLRLSAWLAALMVTFAVAQEAPIEKTPVEKTPVEKTPVEKTPVEKTPAQKPEAAKVFKDWRVQCEKREEGNELCFIFQDVVLKEGNRHLLRLEIGYVPDKKDQIVAVITVPLGIALPPGVLLKVDEGKDLRLPVEHCIPQGCRILFPVDHDLLAMLKAGKQATVTVQNMNHQSVAIPVSLAGFTAAINNLR
jgi:invasion protein IalB